MQTWLATRARSALPEIIDAAAAGDPQLIRRRDGKEVVVVSREYYEARKPNLRDYLLTSGFAEDDDTTLEDALQKVRESGMGMFAPRPIDLED